MPVDASKPRVSAILRRILSIQSARHDGSLRHDRKTPYWPSRLHSPFASAMVLFQSRLKIGDDQISLDKAKVVSSTLTGSSVSSPNI
jgi:hypothetical protein